MNKPYYRYWGKTSGPEEDPQYHLLAYHSLDVAAVGRYLPSVYPHTFNALSAQTGLERPVWDFVFTYLLLLHDTGKFSVAFQAINERVFRILFDKKDKSYDERHDTLGFLFWRDHFYPQLQKHSPELANIACLFVRSAVGHHGLPPKESANGGTRRLRLHSFFDSEDIEAAQQFLTDSLACLSAELPANFFPKLDKGARKACKFASWRIAGLCTLADWIGSNREFFPYCRKPMPLGEYWHQVALPAAQNAVEAIGLRPARPRPFCGGKGGVCALFPFISQPTELQTWMATVPLPQNAPKTKGESIEPKESTDPQKAGEPSLWIVEDLTGSGKTEAALVLAHRLMAASRADGIYIALPTMATANAMYQRMRCAYRRLYREDTQPSLVLAHSARHLGDDFWRSVGFNSQPKDSFGSDKDESTATAYCSEWLADSAKKALLAEVGVGTIDQALLSILPVRHQALRLAGLQRKILLVDEVHAYDAYTGTLLQNLLEEHARGGGSAIVLSATLPQSVREDLIEAFVRGSGADPTAVKSQTKSWAQNHAENWADQTNQANFGFPLVSHISRGEFGSREFDTSPSQARRVHVQFVHDYDAAVGAVVDAAAKGKCACWVRNTVKDAKNAYRDAIARGAAHGVAAQKITLFHSRFAMVDRARIENDVLEWFGKGSQAAQRAGRVVIATQVVEQSLDLDFDVMLTDLAPIDLLIQRGGRLLRHRRDAQGNPAKGPDQRGEATLTVFAPLFDEQPTKQWLSGAFAGTRAVYSHPALLWHTQRILHSQGGWALPKDARFLIEGVYGAEAPEGLCDREDSAVGEDYAKRGQANLNAIRTECGYKSSAAISWDKNQEVPTRLGEPSLTVALAVAQEEHGQGLKPYANAPQFAWDQSMIRVPKRVWEQQAYQIPPQHKPQAEQLRSEQPRCKYAEIVVVPQHSDTWQQECWNTCAEYHPRFGWQGAATPEEEA